MSEVIPQDFLKEIEPLVKSGLTAQQIADITGLSLNMAAALRNKIMVRILFTEEKVVPSMDDYLKKIEELPAEVNTQKQRIKNFYGAILAALGLKQKQIRCLTGLSYSQVKNIMKRNKELGFQILPDPKREKIRTGVLNFRLLESMFCSAYCRIVGMQEFYNINICAAIEAYRLVMDSLSSIKATQLLESKLAFKDMIDSLWDFREKLKGFQHCPHCGCLYVTNYSKHGPHYTRDCPFCYFKDQWCQTAIRQEKLRAEASKRAKLAKMREAEEKCRAQEDAASNDEAPVESVEEPRDETDGGRSREQ